MSFAPSDSAAGGSEKTAAAAHGQNGSKTGYLGGPIEEDMHPLLFTFRLV